MKKNRIALACDKHGFPMKEALKKWLIEEKNAEIVIDMTTSQDDPNFPDGLDQMRVICKAIQRDECRHAIMICGTGMGFSMMANMYWGIRAAAVQDELTAYRARKSQNAHIICIGAWCLAVERAKRVVSAWYDEPFDWRRESSVRNLQSFLEFNNEMTTKPDDVAWSMGFSAEDQGEWYYPLQGD